MGKGHKRSAITTPLSKLGEVIEHKGGRNKEAMHYHELAIAIFEHATLMQLSLFEKSKKLYPGLGAGATR